MAANVDAEEELRLLEEASRVLPADVLELLKAKPPHERLVLLRALVQAVDIEYGQLTPKDWAAVKRDPERFGFKPSDLPDGLDVSQCVALAARSGGAGGGSGGRQLCAFLVATLEPLQSARRRQVGGSGRDGESDPWARGRDRGGGGGAHSAAGSYADEDVAAVVQALSGAGAGGAAAGAPDAIVSAAPGDGAAGPVDGEALAAGPSEGRDTSAGAAVRLPKLGIALQLLGVNYEFRRQGIAGSLMDLLGNVAAEAGAGVVWLWAARHNPSALAFWLGRGFQETRHETSSPAGEFVLMLRREDPVQQPEGARGGSGGNGGRGSAQKPGGFGAGGGGGGAKRRGKRGKAKAWNSSVEVVRSKHTPAAAAESLANVLPVSSLCSRDARGATVTRAAGAGAFDALHHRDHAFTRGDATTGWEHATSTGPREQRRWLAALDGKVSGSRERRAKSLPRDYKTLVARQQEFSDALRGARQARVEERRTWARSFGPEGAAAMERAAAGDAARARLGAGPRPRPRVRPTADDLRGVAALPDMGLLLDD